MHRVDFTGYSDLLDCPGWWVNFVECSQEQHTSWTKHTLQAELEKYNIKVIEGKVVHDIAYLEFDTEEDYLAFKIRWV